MPPSNPRNVLKLTKRIADPIHGLIRITKLESKILAHEAFQRLRNIKQLGMAEYVYPGATHNRFTHSLGVLHNVDRIYDAAYKNWIGNNELSGEIDADFIFHPDQLQVTRLAALCHDLGHFPFSHNLEPAFDWLEEANVIPFTFRHEALSSKIVDQMLGPLLDRYTNPVKNLIEGNYCSHDTSMFLNFLVSSALDADRMDYLIRDAYHCGVDYGRFDKARLLDTIYPYSVEIDGKKHDLMAIHSKGIEAVEQFLLARHRMHQTIYFNRAVVSFEAGLRRAYYRLSTKDPTWELPHVFLDEPEKFMEFDDYSFFSQLKTQLRKSGSWLVKPLLHRSSVRKMGPFFYTEIEGRKTSQEEKIKFELLDELKKQIEIPHEDWFQKDNWAYVELKEQTLVNSLPKAVNHMSDEKIESQDLKNSLFLIDNNGTLIDPTDISQGHSFLPFISGHTYYRFLFFCHKSDSDRLSKELDPLKEFYQDYQWQQLSLNKYFQS